MTITLNIDYRTVWGERLYAAVGNRDIALDHEGDGHWRATIDLPDNPTETIEYTYSVRRDDGTRRDEEGPAHRLEAANAATCDVYDRWMDRPANEPFYSSAFTRCILRRQKPAGAQPPAAGMITFEVAAPEVRPGEHLVVCGASKALGGWNPARAPRLSDATFPMWRGSVVVTDDMHAGTEYKFVTVKSDTGEVVAWETGENRSLPTRPSATGATVVAGLRYADSRARWRGAGTAIPVFALRTETDYGVGEFLDLIPMIDWCAATGQTFLQVLPVNDTTMTHTWLDSYPYNANSTIALHPMYLRLSELGTLDDTARQAAFDTRARALNTLPEIDYEQVTSLKDQLARALYAQNGRRDTSTPEFQAFVEKNASWLKPYAAYCILRDLYGTSRFADWGEYAEYTPEKMERILAEKASEAGFVYYIQYHLDRQLRRVRDYGHSKGVALKGDIPIGISRASVDAWASPELFNMHGQAGAPPDDFSVLGQNWGFPTYNWQRMSLDGYAWWKARFGKMSEYFDAYRIDHLLGFFRIWEIPTDAVYGLLGHFNPALPFSIDELRRDYDFWLDTDLHIRPYITDETLTDLFGERAGEVRDTYLEAISHGRYRLKAEYDTQRKVAAHFASQPEETEVRDGLMRLIEDVLFIADPQLEGMYHPRISAKNTYIYRTLNDYERWTFDRLYNDFYYIRHNEFWRKSAMAKLPALIDATPMLVCGEDLGMIPACVPQVMHELQILSLELERMPKAYGVPFGDTRTYPYYSVCTTSSHDMSGIRLWWEEERESAALYRQYVLHADGEMPGSASPEICEEILRLNLQSPAMLCIVPLQDWLATDAELRRPNPAEERINVPKNPRNYWRYRMHLPISALLGADALNGRLRDMIAARR